MRPKVLHKFKQITIPIVKFTVFSVLKTNEIYKLNFPNFGAKTDHKSKSINEQTSSTKTTVTSLWGSNYTLKNTQINLFN